MAQRLEIKIKRSTCKHIESELRGYMDAKRELDQMQQDLIHNRTKREVDICGNIPSDPTGRSVTMLMTNRRLEQLVKVVKAIQSVYRRLPHEKQKLVQLRYWDPTKPLTWDGIAQKLHISVRQVMNWRNEIIFAIAMELGWR